MDKPVVLITGAGRGIGQAVAVRLSEKGYRCALTSRSLQQLKETESQCSGECLILPADLTGSAAAEELPGLVHSHFGALDILINNAGGALSARFSDTSAADWDAMMNLNARAPFLLTRAALPFLRQSDTATVINIGSVVSFKGYEMQAAYAASKHALAGWTKVLARETAAEGIRVHLLAPGGVATSMISRMRPDIDKSDLIQPSEIADSVLFLLQSRNSNAVIDVLDIHRSGKTPFA